MKKKMFVLFCSVATITTVSYMNVGKDSAQSYLLLENVEALAQSEGGAIYCSAYGSIECINGIKVAYVYTSW